MDINLEEFVGGDGGETVEEEETELPDNVAPIRANSNTWKKVSVKEKDL